MTYVQYFNLSDDTIKRETSVTVTKQMYLYVSTYYKHRLHLHSLKVLNKKKSLIWATCSINYVPLPQGKREL